MLLESVINGLCGQSGLNDKIGISGQGGINDQSGQGGQEQKQVQGQEQEQLHQPVSADGRAGHRLLRQGAAEAVG